MDSATFASDPLSINFEFAPFEECEDNFQILANGIFLGTVAGQSIGPLSKFRPPASLPKNVKKGIVYIQLSFKKNAARFVKCMYSDIVTICNKILLPDFHEAHLKAINSTALKNMSEVSKLMSLTEEEWRHRTADQFNERLKLYYDQFMQVFQPCELVGIIEKQDLPPHAEIIAIGDIHGNDLRLVLTLKALQKRKVLDQNFRCMPRKVLVFLGDYVDRGRDSLKVLELILTLKQENPNQVHLIRGNHEDLETTDSYFKKYTSNDSKYRQYLSENINRYRLHFLYRSFPVSVYLSQKTHGVKEYMQFSHALFHLYTDPAPLLDSEKEHDQLWITEAKDFSPRIKKLMYCESNENESPKVKKLKEATHQLRDLEGRMCINFRQIYWLDVGRIFYDSYHTGRLTIPHEKIKAYLRLASTETSKVKEIMRGHQLGIWALNHKHKFLVTTLDPTFRLNRQTYMEITPAAKVCEWQRTLISFNLSEDHNQALNDITETCASMLGAENENFKY